MTIQKYRILIHRSTVDRAISYKQEIAAGNSPGGYLQSKLKNLDLAQLSIGKFIELLLQTKRPRIFAENAVYGIGNLTIYD
jgi:hypothetical protein